MGVGDVLGKAKATLKRMPETPTITEPTYGTRCNNCGREIQNDFRFCPYCQTILKPKYCGTCGRELKPDYVICPYCGRRVGQGNQ